MRSRRIAAGLRRIGIVVALILALPVLYGLSTWLFLGQAPPAKVYVFLALGLGAYVLATSLGWIIVGFTGEDEP
jgi:hypothetical protein